MSDVLMISKISWQNDFNYVNCVDTLQVTYMHLVFNCAKRLLIHVCSAFHQRNLCSVILGRIKLRYAVVECHFLITHVRFHLE